MGVGVRWRRRLGAVLCGLVICLAFLPAVRGFLLLPDHLRLPTGQSLRLDLPVSISVEAAGGQSVQITNRRPEGLTHPVDFNPLTLGQTRLDFKLFGLIPLRRTTLEVVPSLKVMPGGHSIGVLLRSQGVLVVGHAPVIGTDGQSHHPGRGAGIEVGDAIISINGEPVDGEAEATRLIEEAGRLGTPVRLELRRRGRLIAKAVAPVLDRQAKRYRLGLYIREGAAGVGTLSFYDPVSGRFGALGHVIADSQTNQPVTVRDGHVVNAQVTAIEAGRPGSPGEKIGTFLGENRWIGSIDRNSRYGIFGNLNTIPQNPHYQRPVPIATAAQIAEGPAEILTVVDGNRVERYDIEVVKVMRGPSPEGKNMVIRVTDPTLLAKTGGIVQGMSGSPIIQNGRLIGAITHVFVNDPTRGYGIFIETMLEEAGLLALQRQGASPYNKVI